MFRSTNTPYYKENSDGVTLLSINISTIMDDNETVVMVSRC